MKEKKNLAINITDVLLRKIGDLYYSNRIGALIFREGLKIANTIILLNILRMVVFEAIPKPKSVRVWKIGPGYHRPMVSIKTLYGVLELPATYSSSTDIENFKAIHRSLRTDADKTFNALKRKYHTAVQYLCEKDPVAALESDRKSLREDDYADVLDLVKAYFILILTKLLSLRNNREIHDQYLREMPEDI